MYFKRENLLDTRHFLLAGCAVRLLLPYQIILIFERKQLVQPLQIVGIVDILQTHLFARAQIIGFAVRPGMVRQIQAGQRIGRDRRAACCDIR